MNTLTCDNITIAVMNNTSNESMIRSVTTVPNALENEVLSYFVNTPQRASSPLRGMMMLAEYDINTACMQSLVRGFSPSGASVSLHLIPRNNWAVIPNIIEKAIHHQFMLDVIVCLSAIKLKPRYIQYKIPPPRINGKAILSMFFIYFFFFNGENDIKNVYLCEH